MTSTRRNGRLRAAAAALAFAVLAGTAAGEPAWVRSEIRLNVRSGAGTQYRILGVVTTGDGVQVLKRAENWTRIRLEDGKEGWIPAGYLNPEPPPTVRLGRLEAEVMDLRAKLQKVTAERAELAQTNATLSADDDAQRSEIERLTMDNMELRAGARWPEWITGASVLAAGMLIGAILHRNSNRRPSSRIRL